MCKNNHEIYKNDSFQFHKNLKLYANNLQLSNFRTVFIALDIIILHFSTKKFTYVHQ